MRCRKRAMGLKEAGVVVVPRVGRRGDRVEREEEGWRRKYTKAGGYGVRRKYRRRWWRIKRRKG